jgi:hypothetical protein
VDCGLFAQHSPTHRSNQQGQRVLYLPCVAVNRISGAYRGEGKTDAKDAKDAAIIADQAFQLAVPVVFH